MVHIVDSYKALYIICRFKLFDDDDDDDDYEKKIYSAQIKYDLMRKKKR